MKPFRSPAFWIVAIVLAIAGIVYSYTHFTTAFPLLDQRVTMDSTAARKAATALAARHQWSPGKSPEAVSMLQQDNNLTTFIELEAGGKQALAKLISSGAILPDRWVVRLFREKNASETSVEFSTQGRFLGFFEKLPDAQPGRNLKADEARALAEKEAAAMGLSLDGFKLAASTDHRVSSGRVDQTFTYEHASPELGAGRQQCVLTVCGDRFCGFHRGVKIPDEFFSRFSVMRASNKNLSLAFSIAFWLIIVAACTGGALGYLGWRSALSWRGPLVVSGAFAVTGLLSAYGTLPLSWFGYDTAQPASVFETTHIVGLILIAVVLMIYAPILAAAEGLSRVAFPDRPQLWRAFSPRCAGTRPLFGAVLGGYLLCMLMAAYEVAVHIFGARHLGWWLPSQNLFDPSLLSSRLPWATPLSNALVAGISEECLFRAMPLAWAVILGKRYGRKGLWIGGVLVLQAVIFGMGHSSYPSMPGWARMTELFIPAIVFGLLYLRFGLIPGMVMHFAYDALCMGLPLYTSRIHGSTAGTTLLGALVLAPLAWVTFWRIRNGGWRELPEDLRNAAWTGVAAAKPKPASPAPVQDAADKVSQATLTNLFRAGLVALVLWIVCMRTHPDYPVLTISKPAAVAAARVALEKEGVHLDAQWRPLAAVQYEPAQEGIYVWKTAGKAEFNQLLGTYLAVPGWNVRFVRDTIPLPDRTEEYRVALGGDGKVLRFSHIVPEARTAKSLDKTAAQHLAESELKRIYGLDASTLTLVSANQTKQPKRIDWAFVWKDPRIGLGDGEARLFVGLAGDALSGYSRYVFVPEAWTRAQSAKDARRNLTAMVLRILLVFTGCACIIGTFARSGRKRFATRAAISVAICYAVVFALQFFVKLPGQIAWFPINETIATQETRMLVMALFSVPLAACFFGALAGIGSNRTEPASSDRARSEFFAGLGAGLLVVLAKRLIDVALPHWFPWHAGSDGANSPIPYLGGIWVLGMLMVNALLALSVQRTLDALVRPGVLRMALFATLGLVSGAISHTDTWTGMSLYAVLFAVAFPLLDRLVARSHPSVIVAFFTAERASDALAGLLIPGQPASMGDGAVGVVLAVVVGWMLFRWMRPQPAALPPLIATPSSTAVVFQSVS